MKIINHSDIYRVLQNKADILNNKVPLSQLPDNIIHNGQTGLIPIEETPTLDEDGVTLRFANPHNLSMGQYVVIDDNGGVIPIGIRESFFTVAKFPQMRDKKILCVFAVPNAYTLKLGTAFSSNGPSVIVNLNRAVVPIGDSFTTGSAGMYCLEKDNDGNLLIAFTDGNTNPASKITVKKFDGTSWNIVGTAGFTSEVPNGNICFAVGSDNTLYVAYKGNTTSKCIVMKYDGNSWITLGTPLPVTGTPSYINLCVFDTTPYIAFQDSNQSNRAVVMKYDNSAWTLVGENPVSDGSVNNLKMKIDTNGNIYVAYPDITTSPVNKLTVKMFDGTSWTTVGTKGFSAGAVTSLYSIVFNNNVPYLFFYDNGTSKNVISKYFSGSWSILDSSLTASGSNYTLGITSDEKIYVTCYNFGIMKAQMSEWITGSWQPPVIVADDFLPVGTVIDNEYYICGKSFLNGKFIVGNLSEVDNGSGNWKISNITSRYDISDLDFNNDGSYDIDLNGLLFQKTVSSLLYLTVNDLDSAIYFSPYNSSSYGSSMFSLLAIANSINAVTLKLNLKRMSEDIIKVEVTGSLLPTSSATSISGSISNIGFIGYIQGNGIENISKISFIGAGCPFLNESQIIVRRVVNNDKQN